MKDTSAAATLDVGIVHDWFPVVRGGERVAQQMIRTFPQATVYTLFDFLSPAERAEIFAGQPVQVSRLNRWPGVRRYYRYLILHCARAIEEFDVTGHHVVLSSSAALSKGVLTSPDQRHICYIHSPARYAWDMTHDYIATLDGLTGWIKRKVAREMMHRFRAWDMRSVPQVDHFIANSQFIRQRVWKVYRREADVIYPPVDTEAFALSTAPREDFYFTASSMVPYKRMQLIVETFNAHPRLRLIVSGQGPEMARIRAVAGPNVTLLGHAGFDVMRDHMQRARAFVFAAREDFGIVPLEAQSCGTPVIALDHGGTAETVRGLDAAVPTGVHFARQDIDSLSQAIATVEAVHEGFDPVAINAHAKTFSQARFREALRNYVMDRSR